jgi:hypothetical protein
VPAAKVLRSAASPVAKTHPWRCRTKPIRELIPEGFLEPPPETARDAEGRAGRPGLTVGKHRLSTPRVTQPTRNSRRTDGNG